MRRATCHDAVCSPHFTLFVAAAMCALGQPVATTSAMSHFPSRPPKMSVLDLPQHKEPCSRRLSREARAIISREIDKRAIAMDVRMADQCPLRPNFDRYSDQEIRGKRKLYANLWECTYSGKRFLSERYLDFHLQKFWAAKLLPTGLCTASWCDVLGCELGTRYHSGLAVKHFKHRCQTLFHTCFPPTRDEATSRVHDSLVEQFCSDTWGAKGTDRLRSKSVFWAAVWRGSLGIAGLGCVGYYLFLMYNRHEAAVADDLTGIRRRVKRH